MNLTLLSLKSVIYSLKITQKYNEEGLNIDSFLKAFLDNLYRVHALHLYPEYGHLFSHGWVQACIILCHQIDFD